MKIYKKIFTFMLLILFVVSLASCKKCSKCAKDEPCVEHVDTNNDNICDKCSEVITCTEHIDTNKDNKCDICGEQLQPAQNLAKISLELSSDKIAKGEEVTITVSVTEVEDTSYNLKVSDDTLVKLEGNKIIYIADIKLDKTVTITAASNADPNATVSKTLTVVAPIVEGQVGELTSEMLTTVGNASITVTGMLTDYYTDFAIAANNSVQQYQMKVLMSEGYWYGEWNIKGNTRNKMVDVYCKGEQDGLKDSYGRTGHGLTRLYINKNNEVTGSVVKDYMSFPSLWEEQHLWNHLASLNINKFTYDAENEVYAYNIDPNNMDDLYLMTYLSYCLTPLLEDTLMQIYLKVENGQITKLIGQTEVLYYGADTQEEADAMSYTVIELEFSEIGTTVVPLPEVYEAPQHVDALAAALEKMKSLRNYTYRTTDVTTYAPVTDSGEYDVEIMSNTASTSKLLKNKKGKVYNNVSSVGTVGSFGQVTEDAILIATTGKYDYSLDDKLYHTEYSGYKQVDDDHYDYFEFEYDNMALTGMRRYEGNLFDIMPSFDFSPNIFKYNGSTINDYGKEVYTFVLRATDVTRDVAMEISSYSYADDASKDAQNTLTIVVDEDGNLISTVFPYSLVQGTYMGYCNTVYSNFGTTVLEEDTFDDYVPRKVMNSWSEYTTKYYSPNFSTATSREENSQVVIDAIYGESAKDLPAPSLFLDVFGDSISGPFYDWKEKDVDADGNPIYTDWMSINTKSDQYDENQRITNYEEIIEELTEALLAEGFSVSLANTDMTGGESGQASRYICYIKGDIQIVVQNIHTKYFYIYFYKTGDWTLN